MKCGIPAIEIVPIRVPLDRLRSTSYFTSRDPVPSPLPRTVIQATFDTAFHVHVDPVSTFTVSSPPLSLTKRVIGSIRVTQSCGAGPGVGPGDGDGSGGGGGLGEGTGPGEGDGPGCGVTLWVIVKVCPAIRRLTVRGLVPAFAPTATLT